MKRKQVDDICLDKPSKDFCFGKIQEGYKRSKSSNDKKSRVLTYIISRDDLSDKDIKVIKEKVEEMGEIEHSSIIVPEKVIVSSSNVYFVFPFEKQRPFMEAYKEKMIKVPQFFEKLVECVKHLKTNDICPLEVLPETIRFDHKGNFEWHDLNCDFLLKKKFVTERIKDKKGEKTLKVHPPEVINKSDVKEIEPEKSLVYSMGVIFQKVGEKFSEVDGQPPLKKNCQKFLEKMANKVAAERAELDEVLNFSWKSVVSKKVSFQKGSDEEKDKGDDSDKKKWKTKAEYKKGKFTDQEEEMLKHALCRYVKEHSGTEQELLKLITSYKDESVRGAWTKIAECLPDRSVQSCHQLIRNRFHPDNYKGAWTENEEKELIRLYEEKPRKWQEIADELGRTPTNVRDKWKSIGEENHLERNKGYWKPEEIIKLFRIIEQLTGVSLLSKSAEEWLNEERKEEKKSENSSVTTKRRDALTRMFESKLCNYIDYEEAKKIDYLTLEWTKIAKKMKERSKDDCRNIWYRQIYNTISSGCDFGDNEDEILINSILEQDPAHDHEINFSEIDNGRSPKENEIRWKQLSKAASTRALRSTSELVRLVRKYIRESKEKKKQEAFKIHKGAGNKKNELVQLYREEYND